MKTIPTCWKLAVVSLLLITFQARGEWFLSVYGGFVNTESSDVHLKENGNDLTFHNVNWGDESFKGSPYGGYRMGYWFDRKPNWGVSVEWIHAKMVADLKQTVSVTGTRNDSEPLANTFDNLQFTHGYNLFTLNLEHRWFLTKPESKSFWSRFEPYAGIGAGAAMPHMEVTTANSNTQEYQLGGPAFQGFAGMDVALCRYASLFIEGKLTYADVDVDLNGGGSLHTDPLSEHFAVGLTIHLGRPDRQAHDK